jgi:hypothetical protein
MPTRRRWRRVPGSPQPACADARHRHLGAGGPPISTPTVTSPGRRDAATADCDARPRAVDAHRRANHHIAQHADAHRDRRGERRRPTWRRPSREPAGDRDGDTVRSATVGASATARWVRRPPPTPDSATSTTTPTGQHRPDRCRPRSFNAAGLRRRLQRRRPGDGQRGLIIGVNILLSRSRSAPARLVGTIPAR